MITIIHWRLNDCTESVCYSLLLQIARMEMACLFKNIALNFSVLEPFLRQNKKCTKKVLSLHKIDLCLSPTFQGNVSGSSKSGKETLLVLAGKQQNCHDRANLNYHSKNFPIQLAWHNIIQQFQFTLSDQSFKPTRQDRRGIWDLNE